MRYALAIIKNINDDLTINGNWIQDCTACELEEAVKRARATEKANGNRIQVAVVDSYLFGVKDYGYKTGLVRYDIKSGG